MRAYVELTLFKAKRICLLNPRFGKASRLVGGADADLVIDDTLIDVKATRHLQLPRAYLHQLLGYYVLWRIGGIDGFPAHRRLRKLGIYYARYGKLSTRPIDTLVDEKQMPSFIRWFKRRANQKFKPRNTL